MKSIWHRLSTTGITVLALAGIPAISFADTPATTQPVTHASPEPDVAAPKVNGDGKIEPRFESMHEKFLKEAKSQKIGLLFLGDSITQGWGRAPKVWDEHYKQYDPANFGISGDQTQHVLWRIDNGELDGINPKVVVLMIGTNNIHNSKTKILAGVKKIVDEIHAKLPESKLLLLAIFPRGADPAVPAVKEMRDKIAFVNEALAKLDDGKMTRYLDLGPKFLDADGKLPKDIMPDSLHPNEKGYQIWADNMQPLLDEMMK